MDNVILSEQVCVVNTWCVMRVCDVRVCVCGVVCSVYMVVMRVCDVMCGSGCVLLCVCVCGVMRVCVWGWGCGVVSVCGALGGKWDLVHGTNLR